jgi:hypothetical protein
MIIASFRSRFLLTTHFENTRVQSISYPSTLYIYVIYDNIHTMFGKAHSTQNRGVKGKSPPQFDQSAHHSFDQSAHHILDQSAHHSFDQSAHHSINQSAYHSVDQSAHHSFDQSAHHSFDQSAHHNFSSLTCSLVGRSVSNSTCERIVRTCRTTCPPAPRRPSVRSAWRCPRCPCRRRTARSGGA